MVTITLNDGERTINVPQSWSDICLGDYEKWFDFQPEDRLDEIELIARVCGVEADIFLDNPTRFFDIVTDSVAFIFEDNKYEASNFVEIEGQKYVISFTDELTLAEWIDIELAFEGESQFRLSEILSTLCRPEGEKYDNKLTEKRRDVFSSLTMDKAFPLLAFFLHRNELSEITLNLYSHLEEQIAQYLHFIQDFAASGDGIKSLPIWQKIKYFFLSRYLKNRLLKYSDSFSTKSIKTGRKRSRINFVNK